MSGIYADRMVIQHDMPAAVFGSGDPGEIITVNLKNDSGITIQNKITEVASDNRWQLYLDPTAAGGPYSLTVSDTDTSRTFNDVLFGEVWLMSGQSNMANPIGKTTYASLVEGDNYPQIRAFQQRSGWTIADPFHIQFLYAQAYFFARAVHNAENQNVPVAFYSAAYVNSAIHEWMDPASLAAHPESAAKPGAARHFNAYVLPAMGYTFRGMIWDQGENNGGLEADSSQYGEWLRDLITHWRTLSGNPEMLVIVPQLPTLRDEWRRPQSGPISLGANDRTTRIRHGQFEALSLPNVFLIPTWDISDGDIHPRNALEKGERAALVYQNRVMGRHDVLDQGPTFLRQEIQKNQLILHFLHTGSGLALDPNIPATLQKESDPAHDLLGMAIAGADGQFHWANGVLGKDTLTLTSPEVPSPTQARYTWADDLRQFGNLVNSSGLPTPSFRSDLSVSIYQPDSPQSAPSPSIKPAIPSDGVYEGEVADFRSTNQSGSLDHNIQLSGGAFLSTNGKIFFTEWINVQSLEDGNQPITLRYRSKGATLVLRVNGQDVLTSITLPETMGKFSVSTFPEIPLRKGTNRIKLLSADNNLNGVDIDAMAIGNSNVFETLNTPIP